MTPPTETVRAVTIAAARIRLILVTEQDPDKRAVLRDYAVEIIDEGFGIIDEGFGAPAEPSVGDAMLAATVTS